MFRWIKLHFGYKTQCRSNGEELEHVCGGFFQPYIKGGECGKTRTIDMRIYGNYHKIKLMVLLCGICKGEIWITKVISVPKDKKDSLESLYKSISGTENEDFTHLMAVLCGFACHVSPEGDDMFSFQNLWKALPELQPKDAVEAMLLTRSLALHKQAMFMLARATDDKPKTVQVIDLYFNLALKMFRVQNETIETLSRWRRKGEQRVTVQHVSVENGGQAIVGGSIGMGGKS